MSMIFLIISTVLAILFVILLFAGSKYDGMLDVLTGDQFPLKTIYSVGLAWQDVKIAKLDGRLADNLRNECTLYYSKRYSEFYARIIWAQALSFGHLMLTVFFLLAGMSDGSTSLFWFVVGILACLIMGYYFLSYIKEKINTRQGECDMEFPNAISKLAMIVNSGMILHEAWKMIAYGKDGVLYDLMRASCEKMENGASEMDAIYEFGVLTNSEDIKKFSSALIQSIERGGSDLPQFLTAQSSELWERKRQLMLQKGEKAASALLAPIALMFLGVIFIIIAAAMQSFSL